jgi:hypothetical protein
MARLPKRHNRKESLKRVVCHALRTPGDGGGGVEVARRPLSRSAVLFRLGPG